VLYLGLARFTKPRAAQGELLQRELERALADRPALAAARERLAAAEAQLAGAVASRRFTLSAEAGATADFRSGAARRVSPSAGLALAWDADLGGGLAATQRAALARQLQAEELLEAERAATAALTAAAYVEWRLALADTALLDEALALLREAERVAQVRVDAGLSPRLDLARAAAERAVNEAERAAAAARVQRAAAALQVLAGQVPQALATASPRPSAPALPSVGAAATDGASVPAASRRLPRAAALSATTPAQLLTQRPELRAAARAVQAAGAEIGVAADALAPRLRLPGNLALGLATGSSAVEVVTATLAALLEWPLVDGGAARAGVQGAEARWREASALYRDAALAALAEAEGALADAAAAATRQAALERAEMAADAALAHARTLYGAGLVGFLDVVDAQRSLVGARRTRLAAQADGVLAAVAWYRALGRAS
jgi:outer membrane protein TolC